MVLDKIEFPSDSLIITVKVSLHDYNSECYEDIVEQRYQTTIDYLAMHKYEIYASSAGLHYKGKNEKPHAHLHFVLGANAVNTPRPSNPSKSRSDYLRHKRKQEGINPNDYSFDACEFKYLDLDNSKAHYNILSYPLKEGHRLSRFMYKYRGETMDDDLLDALQHYAVAVYEGELGVEERRQKSEEKSLARKNEILKCAKEHREMFDNYKEMLYVLDVKYIAKLPFSDKPRPSDYKTAVQIVAVELGLLQYSDYCLGGF